MKTRIAAIVKLENSEMAIFGCGLKIGDTVDTQWGSRPVVRFQTFDFLGATEPYGV